MEKRKIKILPGLTGNKDKDWQDKIEEIRQMKIDCFALFLSRFTPRQRIKIYKELAALSVREIPLVHIRDDMAKEELALLFEKYKSRYFTIHEEHFNVLDKWPGFEKYLFLEMNTDDFVADNVRVENIGGFCVDLAHYQKQKDEQTADYDYVFKRRHREHLFKCNHLSGYSFEKRQDLHYPEGRKDFDYLKKLPDFVFSRLIAIEIDNPIKEQLKFRPYIIRLLDRFLQL